MPPAPEEVDDLWQLQGHSAKLELPGVEAALDLASPHLGLCDISLFARQVDGHVLGVRYSEDEGPIWGPPADHYVRGEDLVAVYEQTDDCPFRATLYWRVSGALAKTGGVAVDLIISVQTNSLDVTPELRSFSSFSDAEVVCFPASADGLRLDVDRSMRLAGETPSRPIGCARVPLSRHDASYCEMVHPSDWRGLDVRQRGRGIELSWSLLGHVMEKGVIRRLRVRGIFLGGRAEDTVVSALYSDFAGSPPPLTT